MATFDHPLTVNEFLKTTYNPDKKIAEILGEDFTTFCRPAAVCKDGYFVSIQATCGAYCQPRITTKLVDYTMVELGYPKSLDSDLLDYAEDPDSPCDTIYPYVPVCIVDEVIKKHGGIVGADKLYILRNLNDAVKGEKQ